MVHVLNLAREVLAAGKRIGNQVKGLNGPATVIPSVLLLLMEESGDLPLGLRHLLFAETGDGALVY